MVSGLNQGVATFEHRQHRALINWQSENEDPQAESSST